MRRRWWMRLELNQWKPHWLEVADLSLELAPYPNLLLLQLHWQSNCFFDYLWMKDFCFFSWKSDKDAKKWMSHPSGIPLWSSERQLAPAPWKREQVEWAANGPSNALMSTVTECWVSSKLVNLAMSVTCHCRKLMDSLPMLSCHSVLNIVTNYI